MRGHTQQGRKLTLVVIMAFLLAALMPLLLYVPGDAEAQAGDIFPAEGDDWYAESLWDADGLWHLTQNNIWRYANATNNNYVVIEDGLSVRNSGSLVSKAIDLSGKSHAYLSFNYLLDIDTSINPMGYEEAVVYVSPDGGSSWTEVVRVHHTRDHWLYKNVDITQLAAGNSDVRVKFFFDTIDHLGNNNRGWFLNNVRVFQHGDFEFLLQKESIVSQISDLEERGSSVAGHREGHIKFYSPSGRARGPGLAYEFGEYVMFPDETITITSSPYNFGDDDTWVSAGLSIFNRFGRLVHFESQSFMLRSRLSYDLDFHWTPTLSDHYIVVVSMWDPIIGEAPVIDPFTLAADGATIFRPLKVYENILYDDCTPLEGTTQETEDWEAVHGTSLRGRFTTQTSYHVSPSHAWRGGIPPEEIGYPVTHGAVHYIYTEEIDAGDLYWVYRKESFLYPPALVTVPDIHDIYSKIDLDLSFFYMYRWLGGVLTIDDGLEIRTARDGETWTNWNKVFDGVDERFDPEIKDHWSVDYIYEVSTKINIASYLPTEYSPDFRFQLRFKAPTIPGSTNKVWYIDDIQILGIRKPEFDLHLNQISENPLVNTTKEGPKEASVGFEATTPGANFASRVTLSMEQIDGPADISFGGGERWYLEYSTNDFTIVGGDTVPISLKITANNTPALGTYTFRLDAEGTHSEWPEDGGIVSTASTTFVLRVGSEIFTLSEVVVPDGLPNPGETLKCSFWLNTSFPEDKTVLLDYSHPDGWDVEFPGGDELLIPFGRESREIEVLVTAPEKNNTAGSTHTITLYGTTAKYVAETSFTISFPAVLMTPKTPPRPYQTVSPGQTVEFILGVEGLQGETVFLDVNLDETDIVFDDTDITISPSFFVSTGVKDVTITIDVPDPLPRRGIFNVTIVGNIAGEDPASLTLVLMYGDPELRVIPRGDRSKTYQGDPLFYLLEVYNDGDAWADVSFSFSGAAGDWVESTFPSSILALSKEDGGELVDVKVVVDGSPNAGQYSLTVTAYSEENPEEWYDTTTFTVVIPPRRDIDMVFSSGQDNVVTVDPEEEESISLTLHNNGNIADTISLSHGLSSQEAEMWNARFEIDGTRTTSVTVNPGSSSTVNFVFNASLELDPLSAHTINLRATSEGGSEVNRVLTVNIEEVHGILLNGRLTETSFDPREDNTASFSFDIKNSGNILLSVEFTSIITLNQAAVRDGLSIVFEVGGKSARIIEVDAGETKTVNAIVTPSETALAGDYRIEVKASSMLDETVLEESIDLELEILAIQDIVIASLSHSRLSLRTGDRRDIDIVIENVGNTVEEVEITVRPSGGDGDEGWLTYSSRFTLRPGESSDLGSISILIPEGTYSGEYTFVITVSSTNTDPQTETFTLTVDGVERGIIFGLSMTDLLIIAIVLAVVIMMVVAASRSKSAKAAGASEPEAPVEPVEDAEEEQPEPVSDMQIQI